MNINEYLKKNSNEIEIEDELTCIKDYAEVVLEYLKSDHPEKYDFGKIIAYLSSIPDSVKIIRKNVENLKIKLLRYEYECE